MLILQVVEWQTGPCWCCAGQASICVMVITGHGDTAEAIGRLTTQTGEAGKQRKEEKNWRENYDQRGRNELRAWAINASEKLRQDGDHVTVDEMTKDKKDDRRSGCTQPLLASGISIDGKKLKQYGELVRRGSWGCASNGQVEHDDRAGIGTMPAEG